MTSDCVSAYVVVYSVEDRKSFEAAIDRLYEIRDEENDRPSAVILVANKVDLVRSRLVLAQGSCSTSLRFYYSFIYLFIYLFIFDPCFGYAYNFRTNNRLTNKVHHNVWLRVSFLIFYGSLISHIIGYVFRRKQYCD